MSPTPSPSPLEAAPSAGPRADSTETAPPAVPATTRNDPPPPERTATLTQPAPPPPQLDRTEAQEPGHVPPPDDLGATVVQRLSDRLHSEAISRRMQAAGYKMLRPLGEGAFGLVWLAEEEGTGVRVAIKFFAHGGGRQWQMLQEEVRQLAALDLAQGIIHLKDAVAGADPPYYVMPYAEGGSLAERLEKGPLPVPEALEIFRQVVQALAYVHAHGIRHCDLKPANILLDRLGKPLVADFGQAHLSDDASPALGTFFYMAPEQADLAQQIPDTRWDVYGLGALLYAMLTGEPPRKDAALSGELKNTLQLDHRLRRYREGIAKTPKPTAHRRVPGVDRPLAAIIDACLELDPKKRLPGAEAILQALERRRLRRRQRPLLVFGGVAPLLFIAAMLVVGWFVATGQIRESREVLVQKILDNDKATARLGAWGLQKGLNRRLAVVADLLKADGKDWWGLVARAAAARKAAEGGDPARAKELAEAQDQLKEWLKMEAVELKLDEHLYISGLSVVDRAGYMLISVDKDDGWEPSKDFYENGAKRNWAWRDWFSGHGNRDEGTWYPPVKAPHISQPYRSTDNNVEKVELTVPVTVPGDKGPIAVLVATMKWAEMSAWLRQLKMQKGKVAVFNERGQFLMHGDDDVLEGVKTYRDDAPRYDALAAACPKGENSQRSYEDPIDHQGYYVGYKTFDPYSDAEVGDDEPGADGRWGVVVQHARADVLKPIEDLYRQLAIVGVCTLIGAAVFTAGVWFGLIWLLRRQERLGHG